ncbi:MAG: hypothetical protein CDV28_1133 [Candidatus Electronema aureum]|uniref:Uncharacterized protein n=1 Tax=Candidatus Electronema aureum TaxID=2005002 RepID=A0A521G1T2_9BACT|nr:MAG: hypothetical protein CDV28_1133 [Candidatus Electronema aureum]
MARAQCSKKRRKEKITWRERNAVKKEEKKKIQLEHLNPLRLFLVECHFRLAEIRRRVKQSDSNKCDIFLFEKNPDGIKNKEDLWFNREGCYLVSSCYLAACLFSCLNRVRESVPFLELSKTDDTRLLALSTKVSLRFLRNFGIFYVSQFSIGHDLYNRAENRLLTYREFCNLLRSEDAIWFSRLIEYFIQTGQGQNLERIDEALAAMAELSSFLDSAVGGGESLGQRYRSEGVEAI